MVGLANLIRWKQRIASPVSIDVPTASLTITGYAPIVSAFNGQTVYPSTGSLAITGYVSTVTVTDTAIVISPGTATIVFRGYAPRVRGSSIISRLRTLMGVGE
jgi:hypothetical protein